MIDHATQVLCDVDASFLRAKGGAQMVLIITYMLLEW